MADLFPTETKSITNSVKLTKELMVQLNNIHNSLEAFAVIEDG